MSDDTVEIKDAMVPTDTPTTDADVAGPQLPAQRLASFGTVIYGVPVLDFGEDGEMVVIGHHEPRRVIAAMNAHYRAEHRPDPNNTYSRGIRPRWAGDLYPDRDLAQQKRWWATYHDTASSLGYQWWCLVDRCPQIDEPHHRTADCTWCAQLAESTWVANVAPADATDAFAVVIWEP